MGTPVPAFVTHSHHQSQPCQPWPASPSPPASPGPPPGLSGQQLSRPPSCCRLPPPGMISTLPPSSSELALPPSVWLAPEQELAPCSAPSSLATPGTPP